MGFDAIPEERRREIVRLLDDRGVVRVSDLSRIFDVSEMTIRRDLMALEEAGVLSRSHGGAVSHRRFEREPPYAQKGNRNILQKQAIGRLAATLVEEGETVFVNSGSTTLEVLRSLSVPELRVVTSNAGALSALSADDIECVLAGGVYRRRSNSFVGGLAVLIIEQIYAARCFIGVDGIDVEAGLSTPHHQEAEIARLMIRRTRGPVVVLADSSKIGGVSPFVTAPAVVADILVTDDGIPEESVRAFEDVGVRVMIASTADSVQNEQ